MIHLGEYKCRGDEKNGLCFENGQLNSKQNATFFLILVKGVFFIYFPDGTFWRLCPQENVKNFFFLFFSFINLVLKCANEFMFMLYAK